MANELHEPDYCDTIVARDNMLGFWVIAALAVTCIALSAVVIAHYLQPKPPPYILEVKCDGADCEPVGVIQPILAVKNIPNGLLHGELRDFIHDTFSIDDNVDEEQRMWDQTAGRVTGAAFTKLDQWYHRDGDRHDPRIANRYMTATAMADDLFELPNDRYMSNFTVTTHQRMSTTTTVSKYRITMHVIVGRSKDAESAGWFIDDLDFLEVKQ